MLGAFFFSTATSTALTWRSLSGLLRKHNYSRGRTCQAGRVGARCAMHSGAPNTSPSPGGGDPLTQHMERLRSDTSAVMILDGGTGEELFLRGVPDDRKIWSAKAVVDATYHQALRDVHRSFIEAGSDAVTANSYGIIPGVGFDRDEIARYVALAGRLARQSVRDNAVVLGSLGPLVESYRPDRVMDHAEGVEFYGLMCEALSPSVDCFLAETMSSVEEASQAVEAAGTLPKPLRRPMMVSFTLNSRGSVRSEEAVTDAILRIVARAEKHHVHLCGVLFNCAEPESISEAFRQIHSDAHLQRLLKEKSIKIGAYANRLTPVPDNWTMAESEAAQPMRDDLSPNDYFEKFVRVWVKDFGVQIVGGCCGITPQHIAYLRSHLDQ